MSNVGMSNERCQMQLSNDQITQSPNDQFSQWVVGSSGNLTSAFDIVHWTFDIGIRSASVLHPLWQELNSLPVQLQRHLQRRLFPPREGGNDCVHRGNGCIHHGIDCVRLQEIHFRRGDDWLDGGNDCFLCVNDRIRSGDDRVRTIDNQDAFGIDRLRLGDNQ